MRIFGEFFWVYELINVFLGFSNEEELKAAIYDILRTIKGEFCWILRWILLTFLISPKDPEKPSTLEELNVVSEDMITVKKIEDGQVPQVRIGGEKSVKFWTFKYFH